MSLLTNLPSDILAQIMLHLPEYTDIGALCCSCKKFNQTLITYKSFLTNNGYISCSTKISVDFDGASLLFVHGNEAIELYFYGREHYEVLLKKDPFLVKIKNISDCKNILAEFTYLRLNLKTFTNDEWEFVCPKFDAIYCYISQLNMNISCQRMKEYWPDRHFSRHVLDKKEIEDGVDYLQKHYLKCSSGRYLSDYVERLIFNLFAKMREKPEI